MASNRNRKPNVPQMSDRSATSTENRELDRRVKILEDLVHALQDKENVQIKELQNKVEKLEAQVTQHKSQIKDLEDKVMYLEGRDSNGSEVETAVANQTRTVVRQKENDRVETSSISNLTSDSTVPIKDENMTICTTDLGLQREEHHSTVPSGQLQSTNSANESKKTEEQSSASLLQSSSHDQQATTAAECSGNSSRKGRSVARGNNVFTRWMNSRDPDFSIWSNENYRRPLISYISKIYGQRAHSNRVLGPLRIEFNRSDELDQLYQVIRRLAEQPGAEESLHEWRTQNRPNGRLAEITAMFEYNSAYSLPLHDFKISLLTPNNLEQIIPRDSIKGYFDLICRDGMITADIGEYLHLNRENIFGGNDYDCHNERVTFVNVNLDQSTIDLANNRVDLVTCLVTLHHVPDLDSMVSELVRILRPNGHLLLREHDCKKERSLLMKYLNFIHAFMMIARVGEFGDRPGNHPNLQENDTIDWEKQKSDIINYTNSIQYRSRDEWNKKLEQAGFRLKAVLDYDTHGSGNPQALYYAIYQLNNK